MVTRTLLIVALYVNCLSCHYCVVTRLRDGRFLSGKGFAVLQNVQTGCGFHPAFCLAGTVFFNVWVKRPGRDTDNWPVCSAGSKNERNSKYIHWPICLRDATMALTSLFDSDTWFTVSRLVATLPQNHSVIAFPFQLKFISECLALRFIIAGTSVIIIAVQEKEKHTIRYMR